MKKTMNLYAIELIAELGLMEDFREIVEYMVAAHAKGDKKTGSIGFGGYNRSICWAQAQRDLKIIWRRVDERIRSDRVNDGLTINVTTQTVTTIDK